MSKGLENMDQKRKKGIILLRWILGIILILNIVVICLEKIKGPAALEDVPYALLTIDGGSMEPRYHSGDGVFVWQTPFGKIKVGDVIVFWQAGELITHQVVDRKSDAIIAKGTANDIEDEPVTAENYRARVLFRIPGMANLQAVYATPGTFIIFTLLLGLLIFGKDIFDWIYKQFF